MGEKASQGRRDAEGQAAVIWWDGGLRQRKRALAGVQEELPVCLGYRHTGKWGFRQPGASHMCSEHSCWV